MFDLLRAAYVRGSATSKAAADSIAEPAVSLRSQVLAAIVAAGAAGMTCDEIEVALELRHQTASARVRELAKAGAIRPVLDPRHREPRCLTRATRSGRRAQIWIATR